MQQRNKQMQELDATIIIVSYNGEYPLIMY